MGNSLRKPKSIKNGIKRVVNKDRGLIEAIFFSYGRKNPFVFSWTTADERSMKINMLTYGLRKDESQRRRSIDGFNLEIDAEEIRVDVPSSGKGRVLEEQVMAYTS